jgi:DNA-binding transcriptional regulator GbsR (MarR family)
LRVEIIHHLHERPMTTAQLAELLGQPLNRLYYHVTELERLGLVRVVETRQKGNLVEKYYQPVAEFFQFDRSLFCRTPEGLQALTQSTFNLLSAAIRDLELAVQNGRIGKVEMEHSVAVQAYLELTPEQIDDFSHRLKALFEEFRAISNPAVGTSAHLALVFYPVKHGVPAPEAALPDEHRSIIQE